MAHEISISDDITKILEDYTEEIRDKVKADIQSAARATAKELRRTSPKRKHNGGEYAKGWTASKQGNGWVVHNKTHYQLTHLLENGHAVRPAPKRPGKKTRVEGIPHIANAEQKAVRDLVKKIEEDISK